MMLRNQSPRVTATTLRWHYRLMAACVVWSLSACANLSDSGLFPDFDFSGEAKPAPKSAGIEAKPVDPLNVDPMAVDPLNAPPPMNSQGQTAMAPSTGSQLVPLGSLSANDAAGSSVKRNGPAPLIGQTGVAAAIPAQSSAAMSTQAPAPPMSPAPSEPTATQVSASPTALDNFINNLSFEPAKKTTSSKSIPSPREQTMDNGSSDLMPRAPMPAPQPPEMREFIPAQIGAIEPMTGGKAGAPRLSVGDSNIVRRFQILSKLLDEGLITQEERDKRRAANVGALLQYSKEPPGIGLDRPVPSPGAISARLQALGRSLEMRAISSRQHELERTTILNSLLPERPDPRAPLTPPPADMFALADAAGRLAYIRDESLISEAEFEMERAAMDRVMRGGTAIEKKPVGAGKAGSTGAKTATTSAAGAMGSAAVKPEMSEPEALSGPVLHLASFRSAEGAKSAFEQAKAKNPEAFANLKMEARKTNIPGQGTFYRLLVGPFNSLSEAESTCVEMKKLDQFCRPTPDGS